MPARPKRPATSTALPKELPFTLATLAERAPSGDGWAHEIKLDGYRMQVRVEGGAARLLTRGGQDWSARFPELVSALSVADLDASVLDGELVSLDREGKSDFQALQNALHSRRHGRLVFFAFDLLVEHGEDLRALPLSARKERLTRRLAGLCSPHVRVLEHLVGEGPRVFEGVRALGLEGLVSKRLDAPYRGRRSPDWLKIKVTKRQEFVVVGYTAPKGSRQHFGALLVAVYDAGKLRYAGKVGTGFDHAALTHLSALLTAHARSACPLEAGTKPPESARAHWVEPVLVAEVSYTELTSDGLLRHPVFHGLREDKSARAVIAEHTRSAPSRRTPSPPVTRPAAPHKAPETHE